MGVGRSILLTCPPPCRVPSSGTITEVDEGFEVCCLAVRYCTARVRWSLHRRIPSHGGEGKSALNLVTHLLYIITVKCLVLLCRRIHYAARHFPRIRWAIYQLHHVHHTRNRLLPLQLGVTVAVSISFVSRKPIVAAPRIFRKSTVDSNR